MITMTSIKQSAGCHKYYAEHDNYYFKAPNPLLQNIWYGKGAKTLGLTGEVDQMRFESMLEGELPNGQKLPQANGKRRLGYDLTFSAPKSFSIAALMPGGDERLISIWTDAVKETIDIMEKDAAQTRIKTGPLVTFENTGNLTFALFTHSLSREKDFQLHIHGIMMNVTERNDGEWRALASSREDNGSFIQGTSERMYKNLKYYDAICKSIAAKKAVEIGWQIEATGNNSFELTAIPEHVREHFSKRSEQIENRMKQLGVTDNPRIADMVALETRRGKETDIDWLAQDQLYKEELASLGFDGAACVERVKREFEASLKTQESLSPIDPNGDLELEKSQDGEGSLVKEGIGNLPKTRNLAYKNAAESLIHDAIDHISQYQSVLDYEGILQKAVSLSVGKCAYNDLIDALDHAIANRVLIAHNTEQSKFTTDAAIQKEVELIDALTEAQKKPYSAPKTVRSSSIAESIASSPYQDTLNAEFDSESRIDVMRIKGNPTAFVADLYDIGRQSGQDVYVLGAERASLKETRAKVSRRNYTFWQKFMPLVAQESDVVHTVGGFLNQCEKGRILNTWFRKGAMVVVDQSESLKLDEAQRLIEMTEKSGAKVIFLHDEKSLGGYRAGNPIQTLIKAGAGKLDLRQTHEVATTAPASIVISDVIEDAARQAALLDRYQSLSSDDKAKTAIIALSRKSQASLTPAIRQALQKSGELSWTQYRVNSWLPVYLSASERKYATEYKPGMVIRNWNKGKRQVEYKTVVAIIPDENAVVVNSEDGTKERINAQSIIGNLYMPTQVPVARGERLIAKAAMKELDIEERAEFMVESIDHSRVMLKSVETGEIKEMDFMSLHQGHFDHDYVKHVSDLDRRQYDRVLVDVKSYAASEALLHDLDSVTIEQVEIFTDNSKKLENRLKNRPGVRITHSEPLITAAKSIDREIGEHTYAALRQDIEAALTVLIPEPEGNSGLDEAAEMRRVAAEKAVKYAIDTLADREAAFDHKDLVEIALNHALHAEKPIGSEDVDNALSQKFDRHELMYSTYYHDTSRWVTRAAYELEKAFLISLKEGQGKVKSLFDAASASEFLSKTHLNEDQREACHLILCATDRFVQIQGDPGTGKSTMLKGVQKAAVLQEVQKAVAAMPATDKVDLLGLAPTHDAVKVLAEKNIKAQTLQSFIAELHQTPVDLSGKLIVLDEASMVSNRDGHDFAEIICKHNGRAVLMGDKGQLLSPVSGKPFELALKSGLIKVACLKEIVRQKNETLKEGVLDTIAGNVAGAFAKIESIKATDYIEKDKSKLTMDEVLELEQSIVEIKSKPQDQKKQNKQNKRPDLDGENHNERSLFEAVAREYTTRLSHIRENTIVIVHTHAAREAVNFHIREGLKQEGVIDEQEIRFGSLRHLDHTPAELKNASRYKPGHIVKLWQDYMQVVDVDAKRGLVTLKEVIGDKEKKFIPEKYGDQVSGIFVRQEKALAPGDNITLTKTNKERGYFAKTEYRVTGVDAEKDEVKIAPANAGKSQKSENDSTPKAEAALGNTVPGIEGEITLKGNDLHDLHWDYAYTKTGYGVQGSTREFGISLESTINGKLANRRSFLIAISRAVHHLVIYTDDRKAVTEAIRKEHGDKTSAIEAMGKLENRTPAMYVSPAKEAERTKGKQAAILAHEKLTAESQQARLIAKQKKEQSVKRWNYEAISTALMNKAEETYTSIMGDPKKRTTKELRFENGLVVSLQGPNAGKCYSFTADKGGGPIQAIQEHLNMPYKDALAYGARLAGLSDIEATHADIQALDKAQKAQKAKNLAAKAREAELRQSRIQKARFLWEASQKIEGTLAERYLKEHRAIKKGLERMQFRYLPAYKNIPPSLIVPAKNEKDEVVGVQRVFLDKDTANKNKTLENAKISTGAIKGAAGIVQIGEKDGKVFIAEGPETAASIALANPKATVLTSFSVSNLGNLVSVIKQFNDKAVIIAADNDGSHAKSDIAFDKAVKSLIQAGLKVDIRKPEMLAANKKTDWNDILKAKGVTSLKESLKANRYKIPNQKQFERQAAEQLRLNNRPILSDLSKQMNQSIKQAAQNNLQNSQNLGGREREIV